MCSRANATAWSSPCRRTGWTRLARMREAWMRARPRTLDRSHLWSIQTPQAFEAGILRRALAGDLATATDDAMLVEAVGGRVRIVESTARNFKITWPEDLERAESLLC